MTVSHSCFALQVSIISLVLHILNILIFVIILSCQCQTKVYSYSEEPNDIFINLRYATQTEKKSSNSSATNPMAEEVGFLNVAMHHLVQDELLGSHGQAAAQQAHAQQPAGSHRSRFSQHRQGGQVGQSGQAGLWHYGGPRASGVASSALSGPKRRSRSQADYMSDGSERYIVTHRKKHKVLSIDDVSE